MHLKTVITFILVSFIGLLACVVRQPTPVIPTGIVSTSTAIPLVTRTSTRASTPTFEPTSVSTATFVPTATRIVEPILTLVPSLTTTLFPTVTPLPDLGALRVNKAVNGRACPGVISACPIETVFYPGYETVVRAEMIIEGETWLAVDHPLFTGSEWVWIWAEFNPLKEVQAVEWISGE